jgi:NAD-dependent SIR2 family protein deacetylase
MERKFALFLVSLVLVLLFGTLALVTAAAPQEVKKIETTGVAQKCLACHGSYDKLAAATAKFKASSGETVTPHQYVPHDEKKDIPDCTECHKPHPIPLEDKSAVVKPDNVDWCYTACHHAQNLQPCKNCH